MQMIADKIIHYAPELYIKKDSQLVLKSIKLICKSQTIFEEGYVYLGKGQDIQFNTIYENQLNIIYIGKSAIPKDVAAMPSCNMIILDSCYDLETVFNEIQHIFDFYNEWDQELQSSIINEKGLQDLIDIVYKIFKNPIYLLDSAYMTLAYSREISADAVDFLWSSIVTEGYVNINLIKSLRIDKTLDYLSSLTTATFFLYQGWSYRSINVNIWLSNKRVASLTILEISDTFNDSHLHLANYLASIITTAMEKTLYHNTSKTKFENFLINLLEGKTYDEKTIQYYLSYIGWKLTDKYSLLKVKVNLNQTELVNTTYTLEYCSILLRNIFSGSRSIILESNIVVIINMNKCFVSWQSSLNYLMEFLIKIGYKGGLSSGINVFSELNQHYKQASAAIDLGNIMKSTEYLYTYKDYAIYHMIDICSKNMDLFLLCHPSALNLFEYDKNNNTDYFYSLYIYLMNDRSLVDSAAALCIHRNTFVYRINKIIDLLNIDLDDGSIKLHILLSYQILAFISKLDTPLTPIQDV